MIRPPERSPERDAALDALLPNVSFDGWTYRALRTALASIDQAPEDARLLFPGGAADMIEAYFDLADRRMEEQAATDEGLAGLRTPQRVRALIALRLAQARPHREAIRRALSVLAMPNHAATAAAVTARTVDSIWHAAGDRSADFAWYTKRAILTGVWSATVLFWLRDTSEDDADTLAFLDRRLAGVRRFGEMRKNTERLLGRFTPRRFRQEFAEEG
jgi:ubiquinone biosynthesis protein COQ9